MARRILLVTHAQRTDVPALAQELSDLLAQHGIEVHRASPSAQGAASGQNPVEPPDPGAPADHPIPRGTELIVVLGGDGTILRGAELSRGSGVPLLGVNLGRVGFLAEAEREELTQVAQRIVTADYAVEERMTLEVDVFCDGDLIHRDWALNEASVEKSARERMLELTVEIDGRPLSTWGCDGVLTATPTGSTAYAFSAGGPVLWPDVEALLVVPISAHDLFARPLVLGPDTHLAVDVVHRAGKTGVMWCDGRRAVDLPPGARVEVRRSDIPVRLARLTALPFTDRLVAKFELPVTGWRGRSG